MSRLRLGSAVVPVVLALGLGAVAILGAGPTPVDLGEAMPASTGRGPVSGREPAPDPQVVRTDDRYFAFATNATAFGGSDLYNVPRFESTDLRAWTRTPERDALPVRPAWADPGGAWTWAPTAFEADDGTWVLFFTARSMAHGRQCIGRAEADAPDGDFVSTGTGPVICQAGQGGSIDPYHFLDPTTADRYLYWKNDGNACVPDCPVRLWGARLDGDGVLTGEAPTALVNHDRLWEIPVVENPAMTRSAIGSPYRLYYSANRWSSLSYSTGYANCAGPLGPCTKITTSGPWHSSTVHAWGPGGVAFFEDFEGKNWMAYHGFQPGAVGPTRARLLFVDKVDFHLGPNVNSTFPYGYHRDAPHPFVDVPGGSWAEEAVAWLAVEQPPFPAAALGPVAVGFGFDPDEVFRPASAISRAELLNWVWKLEGHPGEAPPAYPPSGFGDAVEWVRRALDWVDGEGLMTGYPDNTDPPACGGPGPAPVFRPDCPIARGEYVRLLWRARGSPMGYPDPGLGDVGPTSWVLAAVSWAVAEGHMTGYPDGTFRAGLDVRRDQVATSLRSIYG